MSENTPDKNHLTGIIGSGSFGTALANLIAHNDDVLMYSRNPKTVEKINTTHRHINFDIAENIMATNDMEAVAKNCNLIFIVVPSTAFRTTMQRIGPYLKPSHIIIHGTKGFDLTGLEENELKESKIARHNIHTMSEIISQESVVLRTGCLSGPNLAMEILEGQPSATVIASRFTEVIIAGRRVLDSEQFHVFGSHDILGAELAGALKNAIAVGSGLLGGLGLGKNIQAMLITRGLGEMVYIGKAMGADNKAFLGTAGIGDLVATATSEKSRNYTFGKRLAKGETLEEIKANMPELAEGVRTILIMKQLSKSYKLHTPITMMLYNVVFEGFDIKRAIKYLMTYPYSVDVDFV